MNRPDGQDELERLLAAAAQDDRPGDWAHGAARGFEARVLARLSRRESWAEAVFGLASWRPLFASAAVAAVMAVWAGGSAAQLWDEDWLASQASAEEESYPAPPGLEDIDY